MKRNELKQMIKEELLKESKDNAVERMKSVIKEIEKAEKQNKKGIDYLYTIVYNGTGDSTYVSKMINQYRKSNS